MCLFKFYIFACLFLTCALAEEQDQDINPFLANQVEPSQVTSISSDANENATSPFILATPVDSSSSFGSSTFLSSSTSETKPVVIVMATRIGLDEYTISKPTASSLMMDPPKEEEEKEVPAVIEDNIAAESYPEPQQLVQEEPHHINEPTINIEPTEGLFEANPTITSEVQIPEVVVPDEEEGSRGVEDSTGEGETEEDNEVFEPLPSPVALISPNGEGNNPPLEEEFAEAFKKVGQNGRRRRLRPGARRRVRMRVKKMNGTTSPLTVDTVSDSEDDSSASSSADVSSRIGRTRFRSTTPNPLQTSTVSPFPPFPTSVVKSGPKPLIMKDFVTSGKNNVTPEPQIEKPGAGGYTEKISTYFVSPPVATSTTKPTTTGSNSSAEWLQSDHSKHHDMHHDNGHYMAERDNWEKNYMNLQQNSFYSASSEDVEPQTLASLNSATDKKPKGNAKQTDGHIRESLEDRQYPDSEAPFELRHPSGPSFHPNQKYSPRESASPFERGKSTEDSNFLRQPSSYQNTEQSDGNRAHPVAQFQVQSAADSASHHHAANEHTVAIQQPGHHLNPAEFHPHSAAQHAEQHFTPDSAAANPTAPNFKGSPLDPAATHYSNTRQQFPGLGPLGFDISANPPAPAGFNQHFSHEGIGKSPGPSGPSFGPSRVHHSAESQTTASDYPHTTEYHGFSGPRQQNEIHDNKHPTGHSYVRHGGRVPKLVDADLVHLPTYSLNPSAPANIDKSSRRPTADFQNVPSSPHLTLPMPGLVNVPTPPPEALAMNQVKPHRHFPPHTHSMSDRPDYEPANPPLPDGHVLQQHFDHFVQNSGDFKDIPQNNADGNHLNDFHNFNGQAQGAFSGDHQQRSPPEGNQDSLQDPSRPYYDFGPPYYDKKPKSPNKYEYNKNQNLLTNEHRGYGKPYHYSAESQPDYTDGYTPGSPPGPHNNFYGSANEHLPSGQGQDTTGPSDINVQEQEKKPPTNPFSDVPYVLMFPQLVREDALRPAPPKLMTKEIPVVQASTLSAMSFTPEGNPLLGPGMTAVPVHPRHQMYQVLATAHYEKMMEKYVESKKKPPAAIYTPYGVLVPMGPAGATSNNVPVIHNPHQDSYDGSAQYSQKQHKYHPKPADEKQLLNLLLGAKLPPIGHVHFHKKSHLKNNRINKHINLKAAIEPALDLLAEKLAIKLSALEYVIANQPKLGIHLSGAAGFGHPEGSLGSYSELKPVKTSPPEPSKSERNKEQQQSGSNFYNQQLPSGKPQSSPEFKSYLKRMLKERLTEVIEESHRESHEQHRGPPHHSWLKFRPHHPPGRNPGMNQHMVPMQSMLMPSQVIPPTRWGIGPGNPAGGILGTIKRLFNFGGSINVNVGRSGEPAPTQGFTTGISNGTKIWSNPNPLTGSAFQYRSGSPTVMQPAASTMFLSQLSPKVKKDGKATTKKASKELEKWLDLVLKSTDTSITSDEKRSLMEQYPSLTPKQEDGRRVGKSHGSSSSSSNSNTRTSSQFSLPQKTFSPATKTLKTSSGQSGSQTQTTSEAKISKRVDNDDDIEMIGNDPPSRQNLWKPILSNFFAPSTRSLFNFVTSSQKKQTPTVLKPRANLDSISSSSISSTSSAAA